MSSSSALFSKEVPALVSGQITDANSLSVDGELRKAMMDLPAFFQPDASDRPGTSAGATNGNGSGNGNNNGSGGASSNAKNTDQDPKAQVQYYEKIMLSIAIHSRMLRLHRPWLPRGYKEEKFAYSKEQCIRAARATLRIMSDTGGTAAFLEKWW